MLDNPRARPFTERSTALHEERLDVVCDRLRGVGARSVVDLGCGSGALIERLRAEEQVRRIVGLDRCPHALAAARRRLDPAGRGLSTRVSLRQACVSTVDSFDERFDAAVLVETLEHLAPDRLAPVEHAVFGRLASRYVMVTTPNRDYNEALGLEKGERRHPEHRFEWGRKRFERWASGVAMRRGYGVVFEAIGPLHAWHGSPTQMAVFERRPSGRGRGHPSGPIPSP